MRSGLSSRGSKSSPRSKRAATAAAGHCARSKASSTPWRRTSLIQARSLPNTRPPIPNESRQRHEPDILSNGYEHPSVNGNLMSYGVSHTVLSAVAGNPNHPQLPPQRRYVSASPRDTPRPIRLGSTKETVVDTSTIVPKAHSCGHVQWVPATWVSYYDWV